MREKSDYILTRTPHSPVQIVPGPARPSFATLSPLAGERAIAAEKCAQHSRDELGDRLLALVPLGIGCRVRE